MYSDVGFVPASKDSENEGSKEDASGKNSPTLSGPPGDDDLPPLPPGTPPPPPPSSNGLPPGFSPRPQNNFFPNQVPNNRMYHTMIHFTLFNNISYEARHTLSNDTNCWHLFAICFSLSSC